MNRRKIIYGAIITYIVFALNAFLSAHGDGEMQNVLLLWGPYFIVFLLFLFTFFPKNNELDLDNIFKLGALLGLLILLTHTSWGIVLFMGSIGLLLISTRVLSSNKDS